ncbi:hypothetical protein [Nocardia sp. N2S4-5]|uniref:hypothetical protein n=1 Tax=Nocardia sp. N2S4-5 TaxID=3351565 RepID=UPI0037D15CCA
MGDGYSSDRGGPDRDNNRAGRAFERGCDDYYRDREHGYVSPSRDYTSSQGETARYDKARDKDGRTIEEKSGRVGGDKDEKQFRVAREMLERGEIQHHTLRRVDGERVEKGARELIDGLKRDFPDRFTEQVIPRHVAREILARGMAREPGRQLELPGVGERARQQRARQRAKAREEREREERARVQKEAADRVAREFADKYRALLYQGREEAEKNSARAREEAEVAERSRQRERDQADERARQKQREAADRLAEHAQRAREAAAKGQPGEMVREIADMMRVSRPTPGTESPHREPPQASQHRGGRECRGRERGQERGRGR